MIVDVKISLDANITVEEGRRIGKHVKKALLENFLNMQNVFVHVNPYARTLEDDLQRIPFYKTETNEHEGSILH